MYLYKGENYNIISDPKLTYQKSNRVVTNWLVEDTQRINLLKRKLKQNFQYIHYIYSLLFPKIYNRINNFGIKNKGNFEFKFSVWKLNKQNKMLDAQKQQPIKKYLHLGKNPDDYIIERKDVNPNEQAPIAPAPFYIADKIITRRDGTTKQTMSLHTERKRKERAEMLK